MKVLLDIFYNKGRWFEIIAPIIFMISLGAHVFANEMIGIILLGMIVAVAAGFRFKGLIRFIFIAIVFFIIRWLVFDIWGIQPVRGEYFGLNNYLLLLFCGFMSSMFMFLVNYLVDKKISQNKEKYFEQLLKATINRHFNHDDCRYYAKRIANLKLDNDTWEKVWNKIFARLETRDFGYIIHHYSRLKFLKA